MSQQVVTERRLRGVPVGFDYGNLFWVFALAVMATMVFYPAFALVRSSVTSVDGLTLDHFRRAVTEPRFWSALANSLRVSVAATVGGTILGAMFAWLVVRTDLPARRLWRTLLTTPFLIPPFIGAIAWVYLLGPVGYLNQLYMYFTDSWWPLVSIYGEWGVILVMILYGYPIPYMVLLGPLSRMSPVPEEAARISGAGMWRAMREITLPLLMPTVFAGALLLFMSMLANFGIPAVIGFPARYYVLTTRIYETVLNFDLQDNLSVAAALSVLLAAVGVLVMWIQNRLLKENRYAIVSGKADQMDVAPLGRWRWVVLVFIALFFLISTVLPIVAIVLTALTKAYGAGLGWENLTLANFERILFGIPMARRALWNSLWLSALAGVIVAGVGALIAYMTVRLKMKGGRFLEAMVALPYIVPGTVVALAMILAFLRPIGGISLYNSPWILLIAYVARFMIFGQRTVGAALQQIHESLEEAARNAGATVFTTFKDIAWPLLRPSLYATWFLVFTPLLAELTMSALLWSVGNETLGVLVFSLHEEGNVTLTAAVALMLVALLFVLNGITRLFSRDQVGF